MCSLRFANLKIDRDVGPDEIAANRCDRGAKVCTEPIAGEHAGSFDGQSFPIEAQLGLLAKPKLEAIAADEFSQPRTHCVHDIRIDDILINRGHVLTAILAHIPSARVRTW